MKFYQNTFFVVCFQSCIEVTLVYPIINEILTVRTLWILKYLSMVYVLLPFAMYIILCIELILNESIIQNVLSNDEHRSQSLI